MLQLLLWFVWRLRWDLIFLLFDSYSSFLGRHRRFLSLCDLPFIFLLLNCWCWFVSVHSCGLWCRAFIIGRCLGWLRIWPFNQSQQCWNHPISLSYDLAWSLKFCPKSIHIQVPQYFDLMPHLLDLPGVSPLAGDAVWLAWSFHLIANENSFIHDVCEVFVTETDNTEYQCRNLRIMPIWICLPLKVTLWNLLVLPVKLS